MPRIERKRFPDWFDLDKILAVSESSQKETKVSKKPKSHFIVRSDSYVKRPDNVTDELTPGYVPFSMIDRKIVEKASSELGTFAAKNGMFGAQTKFQRTVRGIQIEGEPEGIKTAEFLIEFTTGYGGERHPQRTVVSTTVSVTPLAAIVLPKTFHYGGQEYPFSKASVEELTSSFEYESPAVEPAMPRLHYKEYDPAKWRNAAKAGFVKLGMSEEQAGVVLEEYRDETDKGKTPTEAFETVAWNHKEELGGWETASKEIYDVLNKLQKYVSRTYVDDVKDFIGNREIFASDVVEGTGLSFYEIQDALKTLDRKGDIKIISQITEEGYKQRIIPKAAVITIHDLERGDKFKFVGDRDRKIYQVVRRDNDGIVVYQDIVNKSMHRHPSGTDTRRVRKISKNTEKVFNDFFRKGVMSDWEKEPENPKKNPRTSPGHWYTNQVIDYLRGKGYDTYVIACAGGWRVQLYVPNYTEGETAEGEIQKVKEVLKRGEFDDVKVEMRGAYGGRGQYVSVIVPYKEAPTTEASIVQAVMSNVDEVEEPEEVVPNLSVGDIVEVFGENGYRSRYRARVSEITDEGVKVRWPTGSVTTESPDRLRVFKKVTEASIVKAVMSNVDEVKEPPEDPLIVMEEEGVTPEGKKYGVQQFNTQEKMYDPDNQKTFTVKDTTPGQGVTVTDDTSGESVFVPEDQTDKMQKVLSKKAQVTHLGPELYDIAKDIFSENEDRPIMLDNYFETYDLTYEEMEIVKEILERLGANAIMGQAEKFGENEKT